MALLTASQRRRMPQGEYALPGKRFPINDRNHAEAALSGASRALHAGNISESQAATVRAKAKKKLTLGQRIASRD